MWALNLLLRLPCLPAVPDLSLWTLALWNHKPKSSLSRFGHGVLFFFNHNTRKVTKRVYNCTLATQETEEGSGWKA